jgi:competence protein ComEA
MRVLISLVLASIAHAQTLPEGPGKDVTEKMCSACHGLQNVIKARMTKDGWTAMVDDMVARGAEGTDDEIEKVTNYLAANFSARKVNVNKAAAEDLVSALGIATADASAIVSYRTGKGKFKDLQDLTKVPGINARKIVISKDFIEF